MPACMRTATTRWMASTTKRWPIARSSRIRPRSSPWRTNACAANWMIFASSWRRRRWPASIWRTRTRACARSWPSRIRCTPRSSQRPDPVARSRSARSMADCRVNTRPSCSNRSRNCVISTRVKCASIARRSSCCTTMRSRTSRLRPIGLPRDPLLPPRKSVSCAPKSMDWTLSYRIWRTPMLAWMWVLQLPH